MTEQMMCVCGHPVARHMNALKCCLSCGCANCVPSLRWDTAFMIGDDDDYFDDTDGEKNE